MQENTLQQAADIARHAMLERIQVQEQHLVRFVLQTHIQALAVGV
jgi:hypothetical protein